MTGTFNCASCSAPLDFTGAVTQKCDHCGSTVIAPHEMFYAVNPVPFDDRSSLKGRALKIAEVQRLIHAGNKIEAIKVFRESFGTGLKEAKDAVEAIERGESVDISGFRVQSSITPVKIHLDTREIGRAAKGVGKVVAVIGALLALGGVLVAAAVVYFTFSSRETAAVPTLSASPASTAPAAKAEQSSPFSELMRLGGEGNGEGRFKDNRHVAVDGKGRIYSSDYSPMQVQVFDADGTFINRWKPEQGQNLYDLAADRDGNLFVANDRGVFKFEGVTGKLLAKEDRIQPRGLALSSDGKLIVTEGKSFSIVDKDLKLVKKIENAAEAASSTFGFDKVAVDGDGIIYMLGRTEKDVFKFNADGKFLNRFPHSGNSANAIAVDPAGRIYVGNTSNINILDSSGQKLSDLKAYQAFGLTFNSEGEMFLASRPYVIKYRIDLEQ
ncbi:MAG: hypothetical protein PSX80_13930 [bacterium]|nr:hypothetical protein [bacterium]